MLGKNGDILSILPCLQAEFKETGVKPTLIVAKEYASLPSALPWLSVEVFDGSFERIGDAIKEGKRNGAIDFVPQMSGVGYPAPVRKHPSFQYDQWNTLALELPRPNIIQTAKPVILLADHSQSSPFEQIEDLHYSIKAAFPDHGLVRLSTLRFPDLLHFLTLIDHSQLLVTIDTSFLHLSRACKTPVIALVTDQPSVWHGSAYHPRMSLHIRYGDFELRKSELLHVAKEILKTS